MTYARFDDRMDDNPKVADAGPLVRDLHAQAIRYCSRELTDGRIASSILRKIARDITGQFAEMYGATVNPSTVISHALACGLIEQDADGYLVHDYLDWNSSREHVLAQRASGRERAASSYERRRSSDVLRAKKQDSSDVLHVRALTTEPRTQKVSVVTDVTTSSAPADVSASNGHGSAKRRAADAVPVQAMLTAWNDHRAADMQAAEVLNEERRRHLTGCWADIGGALAKHGDPHGDRMTVWVRSITAFARWDFASGKRFDLSVLARPANRAKWIEAGLAPPRNGHHPPVHIPTPEEVEAQRAAYDPTGANW